MSSTQTKTLTIFAPAKVNLYLHVTGRMDNGYHSLDSLIAFSDIGDKVEISPAPEFSFKIKGPMADAFGAKEMDASPDSGNLAVQAAWGLSRAAGKVLNLKITLTKNLPIAAGLGGGSSDAGAVMWGLCEWWGISRGAHYLPGLMARLGADAPVCFACKPSRVRGIGDIIDPAPHMGEIPVVLVNPGKACPTAEIFSRFHGTFKETGALPPALDGFENLMEFLAKRQNDLQAAASEFMPDIGEIIDALEDEEGCGLARMSGSGATCFGLFESEAAALKAAKNIASERPEWWVKAGWLNRVERY